MFKKAAALFAAHKAASTMRNLPLTAMGIGFVILCLWLDLEIIGTIAAIATIFTLED